MISISISCVSHFHMLTCHTDALLFIDSFRIHLMTSLHPISSLPRQHAEHFLHRHHADRNKIGNPANALTLAWIYVSEKRQKCFYFITRLHLLTIPVIHVSSTSLFLCSMPFSIRYCTFWTRRVCTGNQHCFKNKIMSVPPHTPR